MHTTSLRKNGLRPVQAATACSDAGSDTHAAEPSALESRCQASFFSEPVAIDDALVLAPSCVLMAAAKHAHGKAIQRARRNAGFNTQAIFAAAVATHWVARNPRRHLRHAAGLAVPGSPAAPRLRRPAIGPEKWRPRRDSNPRFSLERAAQAAENRHFRPMDAERGCILCSPAGRDTRDPP